MFHAAFDFAQAPSEISADLTADFRGFFLSDKDFSGGIQGG
jgi:hypothetical protein